MHGSDYWSRFGKQRYSRRRVLATGSAASIGLSGLALVGCGDDDDDASAAPTPTTGVGETPAPTPNGNGNGPRTGGTLNQGLGAPATGTLDPHTSVSAFLWYWPIIGNHLIQPHRQTLEPLEGHLLESWEQVDDETILLTVRPNVTWHEGHRTDGRDFTAEDVAFNLKRIRGDFDPERSAQFQRASTLMGQDDAEAIDESTVRVTFSRPNALYLHGVADWRNVMVAPETVEGDPNFNDPVNWSGTGPFMVDQFDNATLTGRYVRNPNFWREGRPYMDGIRQSSLPDVAAQQSAFLSGDIDILIAAQARTIREQMERSMDDGRIVAWDGLFWSYLGMNQQRGALEDPAVRRAVFLALDYEEIMDSVYGEGFWTYSGPLPSPLPGTWSPDEVRGLAGYNPDTKEEDIAEARQLLDAAGYPDGDGLSVAFKPPGPAGDSHDVSVIAQGQLQTVFSDINATLDLPPTGEFARHLSEGNYEIVSYVASSGPAAFLDPVLRYQSDGTRNYTKYSDPEVDELIASALAEFDADARNALANELQEILYETVLSITVGIPKQVNAVNNRLRGLEEFVGPGSTIYPYDHMFGSDQLWIEED